MRTHDVAVVCAVSGRQLGRRRGKAAKGREGGRGREEGHRVARQGAEGKGALDGRCLLALDCQANFCWAFESPKRKIDI